MRSEIIVRSLVREWIILEDAKEKGSIAGKEASDSLSSLESLSDDLENKISSSMSKFEKKTKLKNESFADPVTQFGIAMSMPTLIQIMHRGTAQIIRAIAKISSHFTKSDQSSKELWAKSLERAGDEFYKKGHHLIRDFYKNLIRAFCVVAGDVCGQQTAVIVRKWIHGKDSKQYIEQTALWLEIAVTIFLAAYSIEGYFHAIGEGYKTLAGAEAVLSAVKTGHIAEASGVAIASAMAAVEEMLVEAGIAGIQLDRLRKLIKEFFGRMRDTVRVAGGEIKKSMTVQGLKVTVSLTNDKKTNKSDDDIQDLGDENIQSLDDDDEDLEDVIDTRKASNEGFRRRTRRKF